MLISLRSIASIKRAHRVAIRSCLVFMLLLFGCAAESGSGLKMADAGAQTGIKVKTADAEKAAGFLSEAMAKYEKTKSVETDDCVLDGNWKFQVLHLLSQAVELDSVTTLARLDSASTDFGFKNSEHYKKWRLAVTPVWSKDAVKAAMRDRQWWPTINNFPPVSVEFQANGSIVRHSMDGESKLGQWQALEGGVQVEFDGNKSVRLNILASQYYFQMGQAWYYFLDLKAKSLDVALPWEMPVIAGPRVGDCGDYNF